MWTDYFFKGLHLITELLKKVDWLWVHPAFYPMGTGGFFPRFTVAGA
jgi:hypothetical protein